jgi:hypothetical protein
MGWFHTMDPEDLKAFMAENGGEAPTCSLSNKPPADCAPSCAADSKTPEEKPQAKEDIKPAPSGTTACPLPPTSSPPPPPPEAESIYHLCQKSLWEEAVEAGKPYFPPTFIVDGKFTRASVGKEDLVSTANTFYKSTPGAWIVLEINCKMLYGLGVAILSQDAPESTKTVPVKCLQVFGGISTTLPGLITNVYDVERVFPASGRFVSILDSSDAKTKKVEPAQETAPPLVPEPKAKPAQEQAKKSKGKFKLFRRKSQT